jgi:hypothetical protein
MLMLSRIQESAVLNHVRRMQHSSGCDCSSRGRPSLPQLWFTSKTWQDPGGSVVGCPAWGGEPGFASNKVILIIP